MSRQRRGKFGLRILVCGEQKNMRNVTALTQISMSKSYLVINHIVSNSLRRYHITPPKVIRMTNSYVAPITSLKCVVRLTFKREGLFEKATLSDIA